MKITLPLSLSSAGTRQVLSIITQLIWEPFGSINIIEEPEISLHPEAQLQLVDLFAQVVKGGRQILITTHSSILLMALSHAVMEQKLNARAVAIYHVEKKARTGTVAKPLPMNEKGYIRGWVPSFAKVERKLMREWVRNLPEA